MLGLYVGFRGISDMERFSARSESAATSMYFFVVSE
jgi:hypothetical protein